jgi:hypothetical protein
MVHMRNLLVLGAAASVLSFGIGAHQVGAFSPGISASSPEALVHQVQRSDEKGPGARGQDGGGKGTSPGARDGGGKGPGAAQDKGPGAAQDRGGDRAGQDKGDRGAQRSGEKGMRSEQRRTNVDVNADRGRRDDRGRADRRTNVDVDVRGRGGDRDRAGRRTGVDINVDGGRRARGRDTDVNVRGYGPASGNCQDYLRRYKQCMAR